MLTFNVRMLGMTQERKADSDCNFLFSIAKGLRRMTIFLLRLYSLGVKLTIG